MSGGYDNKLVFGSGDLIVPKWESNKPFPFSCGGASAPVLNLLGGSSWYINQILISLYPNISVAAGGFTVSVLAGPSPTTTVGASVLFAIDVAVQASGNGAPGSGILSNLEDIFLHNQSGAPSYIHITANATFVGGTLKGCIFGGITSVQT